MLKTSKPVRRSSTLQDVMRPYAVGIGSIEQAVDVDDWVDINAKVLRLKKLSPGDYLRKMLTICVRTFGWHERATKTGGLPAIEHDPFPPGYEPKLPALTDEVLDDLLARAEKNHFNLPRCPELLAYYVSPSLLGIGGRRNPVQDIDVWLRENMAIMRSMGNKQWLVEFLHQLRFMMTLPRLLPREEPKKPHDPYKPRTDDSTDRRDTDSRPDHDLPGDQSGNDGSEDRRPGAGDTDDREWPVLGPDIVGGPTSQ